jgi:Brp/Blh family beta-carotene 15,15'-monooxygenase
VLLSVLYIGICVAVMAALPLWGAPEFSVLVYSAAFLVAILGVPHGGLDHWTGHRLLASRFRNSWWLMFFPGYLAVGLAVAVSWFAFPVATVIGFFLLSAWHFGREEQHRVKQVSGGHWTAHLLTHVLAIALGGLVIWVPALVRPSEMQSLLTLIIPTSDGDQAAQIVWITRSLAMVLFPIAYVTCLYRLMGQRQDVNDWVPVATAGLAAYTPILVSFTAYFCLWHSILGLTRLRSQEGLSSRQFIAATAPLSVMAVLGVVAIGWLFRQSLGASSIDAIPASLQTLFIGLSAIAVPHLLLHEWADAKGRLLHREEVPS